MAARRALQRGGTFIKNNVVLDGTPKKPAVVLPDGYDSEADFLRDMRTDFYEDINYDRLNRDAALEDARFLVGQQWDDLVRQRREAARKPVLTVNRLPAFVAQVVGARHMNETTVKILPDNGGTVPIARVREGLIRNAMAVSHADVAFDKAFENAVICGVGNFQMTADWSPSEVFNQVLGVEAINDSQAVVWDRGMQDRTGRDAGHCFVVDTMKRKDFNKRWPWATASDVVVDMVLRGDLRMNGWIAIDDVRIVSYWRICTRKRTLAMLQDGTIQDITDKLADPAQATDTLAEVVQRQDGTPVMREVDKKYAEMYLCSGLDILEGPYVLDIDRVPVFRVVGWEINIANWKHRWGLVRFLKDPQRLHNYWRSVIAEKIMQTPRAVWLAKQQAVAGREKDFRNSHLSDDPLLVWNGEAGDVPVRIPPAQIENAMISEATFSAQDLKDVSNIHEANLGMPSNEVSGAAIIARQRVSDTGTIIYQDNCDAAIEECGRVMNQCISIFYDTVRQVKIIGEDAKHDLQVINDTGNPNSIDLSIGTYSVVAKRAPSTATKRIEAAESMTAFINANPQVAAYTLDLVADAMDWPKHEEFARRIRLTLPPGMVDPSDMDPQELQNLQSQQQSQQAQAQLQFHMAMANYLKTQSETTLNNARAEKFSTDANLAPAKVQNESINTASQAADRELRGSLEAINTAHAT
jgi:hypothetical protein